MALKFAPYEADSITPFVANSPFMSFFYEHPTITRKERIPSSHGVIRRDWKYIDWPEYGYQQLFDLRSDPGEIRNLIADPGSRRMATEMRLKLEQWQARVR